MLKNAGPNLYYPSFPDGLDPKVRQALEQLWNRVNFLLQQNASVPSTTKGAKELTIEEKVGRLEFAIQTVSDNLTQGGTFANFGSSQPVAPTDSVSLSGSGAGLSAAGASSSFTITVTSASTFRTAIDVAQRIAPLITAGAIPLAKITGGGTDGSITVDVDGRITAYVLPT
jgi:hypothetical protein